MRPRQILNVDPGAIVPAKLDFASITLGELFLDLREYSRLLDHNWFDDDERHHYLWNLRSCVEAITKASQGKLILRAKDKETGRVYYATW